MPRKLRVEYEGALYHVMSRGDRREGIFLGDVDRQAFLKTLAACLDECACESQVSNMKQNELCYGLTPFTECGGPPPLSNAWTHLNHLLYWHRRTQIR